MTDVPIQCRVNIELVCNIDITQKQALHNKLNQIVQDIIADFPDKIESNRISVSTDFATEGWSV